MSSRGNQALPLEDASALATSSIDENRGGAVRDIQKRRAPIGGVHYSIARRKWLSNGVLAVQHIEVFTHGQKVDQSAVPIILGAMVSTIAPWLTPSLDELECVSVALLAADPGTRGDLCT